MFVIVKSRIPLRSLGHAEYLRFSIVSKISVVSSIGFSLCGLHPVPTIGLSQTRVESFARQSSTAAGII
jgi:hypothetical protein